ncbi:MAG: mismatch repair protein MutS2, partial [Miltoncostaeaceae bacterium]|nr:mismatch repair protein MutS2 [Miltoncostaeaceae bacterium]
MIRWPAAARGLAAAYDVPPMGGDAHSAELLELPAIRELLAAQASFAGSRELALALTPSSDPAEVARLREETEEAIALGDEGVSPPGGARDLRPAIRAASAGARLDEPALADVGDTCRAAIALRSAVLAQAAVAPRLAARLEPLEEPVLAAVASAIEAALDERGEVRDAASPDLAQARRRLARARAAAGETLRQLAQRLRPHLQESFVTERAGRPVLAVKASARGAVPGLVHDSSGSGQTLFVEPLELVEATNRVRELAAVEREEVERVLAALTAVVAARAGALTATADALAQTDLAMARGELGRRMGGAAVEPADEVELIGARHPLLDPGRAVPVDLPLRGVRALVVSGPNAGGKTVALKTLGLAALMHQCGLRVPARRARLPVFDRVLADIGDEQSIARSLSTFSAHVRSLIGILEVAGERSLVLLDEVAGGTDPHEGAALARAVLEALMDRGALVLATSHHPGLKEWASGTEGALNAAVGFDPRSLRPTFELRLGEPGASHALAIAEQLGLEAQVVRRARTALGPEREAIERLLADAEGARRDAAEAAEAARAERDEAERGRRRVAAREADLLAEVERVRGEAAAERARARADAEAELGTAGRELAALRVEIAAARRAEEERARAVRAGAPAARPSGDQDRWGRERERG